jgi:uncharacterized RDD family membrane protein YckC
MHERKAGAKRQGQGQLVIDGRIALTTPEGVRLLLTPAGPVPRAGAWFIDLMVWTGAISAIAGVLATTQVGRGIYAIVMFASYWGYPIVCEVYFGGRSPGKRAMGLEVVRANGLPVGWRESALRNLLLVADFMPFLYFSGLICMLSDKQYRRLGDIVAGTQVVYHEKPPARLEAPEDEPLALPFPLSPAEQRVLGDLVDRAPRLAPERLDELGTIAEPLTGQTGSASLALLRRYAAGLRR